MSKFSHSWQLKFGNSSGALDERNNNFVGQRPETISIVNDNEFLNLFLNLHIFLRNATPGEFAYIRKSERDRMNVLKFLKNAKLLFKFRHCVILNSLLC